MSNKNENYNHIQPFIIGTAGHIDHGKTTLVNALTQIQTDTTPEEKERGLTINLGFAYLDLPSGQRVGVIDVPGHERFVKNMLSGAMGVDLGLVVIDSHEGIMPQTREHIEILNLLGVTDYVVVLTKVASVSKDWLELVELDLLEQFKDTPLEDASIVKTDALEGIGLEELIDEITSKAETIQPKATQHLPRLNVDRAFQVKGIGTIVTGTLLDSPLSVGDSVTIYPAGKTTTIRSIQMHEESYDTAPPNNRVALNLPNVSVDEVPRGSVICAMPDLKASDQLDVSLEVLASHDRPIQFFDRVHLYLGTTELLARVVPLEGEEIHPGENKYAQLRLETPVVAFKGDHFIIRQYSPLKTIAGGEILDTQPERHAKMDQTLEERFEVRKSGDALALLMDLLSQGETYALSVDELVRRMYADKAQINEWLSTLLKKKWIWQFGEYYITRQVGEALAERFIETLDKYHQQHPQQNGMSLQAFRSAYGYLPGKVIDGILTRLENQQRLLNQDGLLASSHFTVILSPEQETLRDKKIAELRQSGIDPAPIKSLFPRDDDHQAVFEVLKQSELVQLDHETVILESVYETAKKRLIQYLQTNETVTLPEYRDFMQTNRKAALRMLDYFDKQRVTLTTPDNVRQLHPKYR